MIGVIILPLAYVTARKGHIAVTVFTRKLGSKSIRSSDPGTPSWLNLYNRHLLGELDFARDAWTSQDYYDGDINIPKWIGHGVYVVGLLSPVAKATSPVVPGRRSLAMARP